MLKKLNICLLVIFALIYGLLTLPTAAEDINGGACQSRISSSQ